MASTTLKRAASLPLDEDGYFNDFGVFFDTHRDNPCTGFFDGDLHRGMCHLTPVDLRWDGSAWSLVTRDRKQSIAVQAAHRFVSRENYTSYITACMARGEKPFDREGHTQSKFFRDPRRKPEPLYLLKSFRQIVQDHQRRLFGTP